MSLQAQIEQTKNTSPKNIAHMYQMARIAHAAAYMPQEFDAAGKTLALCMPGRVQRAQEIVNEHRERQDIREAYDALVAEAQRRYRAAIIAHDRYTQLCTRAAVQPQAVSDICRCEYCERNAEHDAVFAAEAELHRACRTYLTLCKAKGIEPRWEIVI